MNPEPTPDGTPQTNAGKGSPGAKPRKRRWKVWVLLACALVVGLGIARHYRLCCYVKSAFRGCSPSVVAELRALADAEELYKAKAPPHVYGTLSDLSRPVPPFVHPSLGGGLKYGHAFRVEVGSPPDARWRATAEPVAPDKPDAWRYTVDQSGTVRGRRGASAGSADTEL